MLFVTPETFAEARAVVYNAHVPMAYDLFILDDLNPSNERAFHDYASALVKLVIRAFAEGGKKILVTSDASGAQIIDRDVGMNLLGDEKARFMDRYRTMFKEQRVEGASARPTANWDAD